MSQNVTTAAQFLEWTGLPTIAGGTPDTAPAPLSFAIWLRPNDGPAGSSQVFVFREPTTISTAVVIVINPATPSVSYARRSTVGNQKLCIWNSAPLTTDEWNSVVIIDDGDDLESGVELRINGATIAESGDGSDLPAAETFRAIDRAILDSAYRTAYFARCAISDTQISEPTAEGFEAGDEPTWADWWRELLDDSSTGGGTGSLNDGSENFDAEHPGSGGGEAVVPPQPAIFFGNNF